jgi:hypothetical protein
MHCPFTAQNRAPVTLLLAILEEPRKPAKGNERSARRRLRAFRSARGEPLPPLWIHAQSSRAHPRLPPAYVSHTNPHLLTSAGLDPPGPRLRRTCFRGNDPPSPGMASEGRLLPIKGGKEAGSRWVNFRNFKWERGLERNFLPQNDFFDPRSTFSVVSTPIYHSIITENHSAIRM